MYTDFYNRLSPLKNDIKSLERRLCGSEHFLLSQRTRVRPPEPKLGDSQLPVIPAPADPTSSFGPQIHIHINKHFRKKRKGVLKHYIKG